MIPRVPKRYRPRTGGPKNGKLPTLTQTPGAIATLAAMLGFDERQRSAVVRAALARGLITGRGSTWHTNRKKLNVLFCAAGMRAHRPSPMVLYGLGELLARGSGEEAPTFEALAHLKKQEVRQLLRTLSQFARTYIERKAHANIASRELVHARKVDKCVLQRASAFLSYPPNGMGLYGYSHAVVCLLLCHPRTAATWLQQANLPADLYATLIGKIADELRYRAVADGRDLPTALIQTGVPAFQALAICALAGEGNGDAGFEFGPLLVKAQALGVDTDRAFGLALIAVENARVSRAILEGKLKQTELRLAELARDPDAAHGGRRNAKSEIKRLGEWHEQQKSTELQVEQQFERLVQALAAALGNDPALVRHMEDIQKALTPFAPEVLVQVGETLGSSPAAGPVLNSVIELGAEVLGLNAPISFEKIGELNLDEFEKVRMPMARAIELRYRTDPKGVGRRTGQLLSELSKAGDLLLGAPYAALRWPRQYQGALRRRMASVLIAIDVARAGAPQEQQAKSPLIELAISQAELLLRKDREDIDSGRFGEAVAQLAIDVMQAGQVNDRRMHWLQNQSMDAFSRALAIWSQPAVVHSNEDEAKALFLLCTEPNVRQTKSSRPLLRALNLLDMGFASAVQASVNETIQLLKDTWYAALLNERILGAGPYVDSFDLLFHATQNRQASDKIIAHPVWRTSRTAVALSSRTTH